MFIGTDVSKDRLDVHVRSSGEAFAVARDGEGLERLADRLRGIAPLLVVPEAAGGLETAVAGAGLPLAVAQRRRTPPPHPLRAARPTRNASGIKTFHLHIGY